MGKGDCKVTVRNQRGKEIVVGKLDEGDHFGEIAMIYNTSRSATVYSMNYNTFALMRVPLFRRLVQDYPEYEASLKKYVVAKYKDHRVLFLQRMVRRVEYLDKVPEDIMIDLIFSLKTKTFSKEEVILTPGDNIEAIYFIEEGAIEVSTEFEQNVFILDVLGAGSVINYRAVFLRDQMYVEMKALTDVKVQMLSLDTLMQLVNKYGEVNSRIKNASAIKLEKERNQAFSMRVLIAQNRYLKGENQYPVDYLKNDPKVKDSQEHFDKQDRRNLLKNVVMRIVVDIREQKKRPKLSEVMKVYESQKNEPDAKVKF